MNKTSGDDGIPAELFQNLKHGAVKVLCSQYPSIFGKLGSGHRTGKGGQFSFQSQRRAMPKNVQNTTQSHSSHTLAGASLVAQRLKRLPAVRETWVQSLGWEDPLEKERATLCSTLAWKIPGTEKPCRL